MNSANQQIDCLGVGIIPVDYLYTVPFFPPNGGKVDASNVIIQGGGPVPNCMVGLSRLGWKTSVIALIGNDYNGRFTREELRKDGVSDNLLVTRGKESATAFGFIQENTGMRTIAFHRSSSLRPADIVLSRLPIPKIIHLDGRDVSANMKVAQWGKKIGATLTFDIGSIRNDVTSLLPLIDHLIVADSFAFPYTGSNNVTSALKRLSELCNGTIVITEGLKGSTAFIHGRYYSQSAYKVKTVDTTGAGDAFHVGYIHSLLHRGNIEERLLYGAVVSALKCTKAGARTGMPTKRQINHFMKKLPSVYA